LFQGTFCERATLDALLIGFYSIIILLILTFTINFLKASRIGDTKKVFRLIKVGARKNIQDIEGNSPLILGNIAFSFNKSILVIIDYLIQLYSMVTQILSMLLLVKKSI
jgi:hypothetical protein